MRDKKLMTLSEIEQKLKQQNIPIPSAWDSFKGLFPAWIPAFAIVALVVITVCYFIDFKLAFYAFSVAFITVINSMVRQSRKALKEANDAYTAHTGGYCERCGKKRTECRCTDRT
jgi:hypothetical protein